MKFVSDIQRKAVMAAIHSGVGTPRFRRVFPTKKEQVKAADFVARAGWSNYAHSPTHMKRYGVSGYHKSWIHDIKFDKESKRFYNRKYYRKTGEPMFVGQGPAQTLVKKDPIKQRALYRYMSFAERHGVPGIERILFGKTIK